jgi:hypothetical protein
MKSYIIEYMSQRVTLLISVTFSLMLQILTRYKVYIKKIILRLLCYEFGSMRSYITEYMLQRVTLLISVTFSFGLQILARRNVNFKMHMLLRT